MPHSLTPIALAATLLTPAVLLSAQTPSQACAPLSGIIRDTTSATVAMATVTLDPPSTDNAAPAGTPPVSVESQADGSYRLPCVTPGPHRLRIEAESFSPITLPITATTRPQTLNATLQPESVQTSVDVSDDTNSPQNSPNAAGPSQTLSGKQLQSLADDPDDLQRELTQLAAAAGGSPSLSTITVDGFQGPSRIPPKSSIAYIKVNPDPFSAEYREPPFNGGRIEIYTKPGQKTYHGALFATNGSPWMNARDPFSPSKASLGKQRYGFELQGPLKKEGADFALDLEHRSIDNAAVVNAITLDNNLNPVSFTQNVATPQRLWQGTARVDWQLNQKNTFIATFSSNVNHLSNVGTGGTALAETGYDSQTFEHTLRFTDVTTVSAKLMHEARVAFKWTGETDTPISTAPQLQVAGAFTSGGATLGAQRLREFSIEADDDAILSLRHHLIKFGTQLLVFRDTDQLTSQFNGTYTFGGGVAPVLDANNNPTGATAVISGLEQYRRARLGLPGGAATAFTNVAGTPFVQFTQVRDALFVQDDWTIHPRVKLSLGFRYFLQTSPTIYNGATPRFGVVWTPSEKSKWTIHGHLGLFTGRYGTDDYAEILREDGTHRITSTVYNPVFNNPFSAGATPIRSMRTVSPNLTSAVTFAIENIGLTRSLPFGFNFSTDFYLARMWNYARSNNINAPFSSSPTGPRPGAADLNVLQVQNSGQGNVNVQFFGLENHGLKRVQFFFGGVRVDLRDDTNDNTFFTPQNSRSNAGELARRSGQGLWNIFGNTTFNLPRKVELTTNFYSQGEARYNITTGFDNNGDGNFNDRPNYAATGDASAIQTPYGLLTSAGGIAVSPRNAGAMPWTFYLDSNLQRAFALNSPKSDHPQVLTINVRSSNLLNHTNVNAVGGVLGSPFFNTPYAADPGRRIEAGLRYAF